MSSPPPLPVLEVDRLSISYRTDRGELKALRNVSLNVPRGEIVVEIRLVGDDPDSLADPEIVLSRVQSGDTQGPRRRAQAQGEHADQRRFAGAVRTEQGDGFTLLYLEREPVYRLNRTERLGEADRLD